MESNSMSFKTIMATALVLSACVSVGQTPISDALTDYHVVNTGHNYTLSGSAYNYGNLSGTINNNQVVNGITLSNGSFLYHAFVNGSVKLRRVNNATSTGAKSLLWMESVEGAGYYNLFPPYLDAMEPFFNTRTINKGTDNLFGNQGDGSGNNNNIERVDWVVASGVVTNNPLTSGFAVFERGADDVHDPFCMAAITALDANGDPSQYGQIVRVATNNYGNLPNSSLNYSILRKEESETQLYRTGTGNQKKGGVFISFQDLGISSGQAIYGYSLFAYDLPLSATPANLVDYTNASYFPTNSSSNTSEGGIDLIAFAGLFNTSGSNDVLPLKYGGWNVALIDGEAKLNWLLEDPSQCKKIEIEKSENGRDWQVARTVLPNVSQFADAVERTTYYRLKLYNKENVFTYSSIKPVYIKSKVTDFSLIPRPYSLIVNFQARNSTEVFIKVYNSSGQLLMQKRFNAATGRNQGILNLKPSQSTIIVSLTADGNTINKQYIF